MAIVEREQYPPDGRGKYSIEPPQHCTLVRLLSQEYLENLDVEIVEQLIGTEGAIGI